MRAAHDRTWFRSSVQAATPWIVTKEYGGRSSCTHRDTRPVRRMARPFTVSAPVVNRRVPSSSRAYQTGTTWGVPSLRTVASVAGRTGGPARNAPASASDMVWYGTDATYRGLRAAGRRRVAGR